jgi:hypothetical protein
MQIKTIKWILSLMALIVLISCTLEEPSIPTWVAEWGIPFDASFTMNEALDDPNFITDTTSTGEARIAISISDTSDEKTVNSSDLAIKPEDDAAGENIDDLTLGTQGPEPSDPFDLSDIIGGPVSPGIIDIAPGTIFETDLIYLLYYDIKYAHIETGTFRLELVNNTPLDIDAGTIITIYDDSTNTFIDNTTIPDPVPSNSSAIADPDIILDDKIIHTRFRIELQAPIVAGSYTVSQSDIDNSTSWVNGTLFDLNVIEAEARFPAQSVFISDSSSIMEEEHRIRKGIIDRGEIFLSLENNIDATARVKVRLLNLSHVQTGETLIDSVTLPPKSTTPKTILVENYRIADYPDSNSNEFVDYIHYEVDILTDSCETYKIIHQDDDVYVTVKPDSLYFRMIYGDIDRIEIEIDPIEEEITDDLSRVEGTIYLDSLQMKLNLNNETNLPIDITLLISGSDDMREVTLDPIQAIIPKADEGGYLQIKLSGNDPSPNIVDLMGILPTTIRMEAEAYVDGEGSVEVGQSVQADYQIFSPLFIRIIDPSTVTTDIIADSINEDTQNQIEKNVKSALFLLDILNGLPVGSETIVAIANDSTILFDDSYPDDDSTKFTISDIVVEAGQIGSDGYVETPEAGNVRIDIDENKRKLFYQNDKIYIGTRVILEDTNNQLVKFRPEDELSLLGFLKFNFLMNNE